MKRKSKIKKIFLVKRKDLNFGMLLGIITGIIGIMIATFLVYFFIVGIIDIWYGDLPTLINNQVNKGYENVAKHWKENELVGSLSYVCSFQETELRKVDCIHYLVGSTINYIGHGIGNQLRKSPEEIMKSGGVCRDYSVLYASLLSNLNISYEFIHKPGHVYIEAYPDNSTCELDIAYLNCVENE